MDLNALKQATWEDTFSRKEIRKHIRKELAQDDSILEKIESAVEAVVKHFENNRHFWYQSKLQRWYLLRCMDLTIDDIVVEIIISVVQQQKSTIQGLVGGLIPIMEYKDPFDSCKTLAEIIAIVGKETDLFDLIMPRDAEEGVLTIESNFEFDDKLKQYIADTMYLPPMLCKPVYVRKNFDYDYLNQRSSKILGAANHHEMKIGLDVLNMLNQTELSLDNYVLTFPEVPNKELDTLKKLEQFNRMANSSRKVYDMLLEAGNKFYNTHKYDKRGRVYSQGYHVHIQSTDYKKSLINLSEEVIIPLD